MAVLLKNVLFLLPSILEVALRGIVSLCCHRSATKLFIYTEDIWGFKSLRKKLSFCCCVVVLGFLKGDWEGKFKILSKKC